MGYPGEFQASAFVAMMEPLIRGLSLLLATSEPLRELLKFSGHPEQLQPGIRQPDLGSSGPELSSLALVETRSFPRP
jgi:hypothetical protein